MKSVALITGGSRGIGLGIALVKQGYRVAINGVRPANQVAEPLNQLNLREVTPFIVKEWAMLTIVTK